MGSCGKNQWTLARVSVPHCWYILPVRLVVHMSTLRRIEVESLMQHTPCLRHPLHWFLRIAYPFTTKVPLLGYGSVARPTARFVKVDTTKSIVPAVGP